MSQLTPQELSAREQHLEERAHTGHSINAEFDKLPANQQMQIIRDVAAQRSNNPNFLPDLTISGGSGRQSSGWHLRSQTNTSERDGDQPPGNADKQLHDAERWHMSQHGDDKNNPNRWYACSATSLQMAMLHHHVPGCEPTEAQRKQLIADLHVSEHDGFHGGTPGMADYARRHGLKAEAHPTRDAQQDIKDLDVVLDQGKGAITNGGVPRPDGSTLKHFVYVSSKAGDKYVVNDPENDKPVLWSREQMMAFLQRNSHGFVAVSA